MRAKVLPLLASEGAAPDELEEEPEPAVALPWNAAPEEVLVAEKCGEVLWRVGELMVVFR